jgi:hypothetical protein
MSKPADVLAIGRHFEMFWKQGNGVRQQYRVEAWRDAVDDWFAHLHSDPERMCYPMNGSCSKP